MRLEQAIEELITEAILKQLARTHQRLAETCFTYDPKEVDKAANYTRRLMLSGFSRGIMPADINNEINRGRDLA